MYFYLKFNFLVYSDKYKDKDLIKYITFLLNFLKIYTEFLFFQ